MTYSTKYPKVPFYIVLVLMLSLLKNSITTTLLIMNIAIIFFIIIAMFIEHQLQVKQEKIYYRILLFSKPIHSKTLMGKDIQKITFKRVGWMTKAAIIQTKKGLGVRIVNFTPKQVYAELLSFAEENDIPVLRGKDFNILMKMNEPLNKK